MQHKASLRDRLTIGLGIIFPLGVIALPLAIQRDPVPRSRPVYTEPVAVAHWFGLSSNFDLQGLSSDGSAWRAVGPLQFEERSDGTARLTGFLMESSNEQALLQLDLEFSDRDGSDPDESHPGGYASVAGFMRGLGSMEGALLSVESGRDAALNCTARHAEVSLRTEWKQFAREEGAGTATRKTNQRFSLDFTHEALWGASDLVLNLGGLEGDFELVAGGHLVERADGSAWMSAVLAQRGYRGRAFHLELSASRSEFWSMAPIEDASANPLVGPTGLMDTGDGTDPAFWRTYDQLLGTLRGIDQFEGALIELSSSADSFRVGLGAGFAPTEQGAFVELTTKIVRGTDSGEFGFARGKFSGDLELTLVGTSVQFAFEATAHSSLPLKETFAANLGELGDDFIFEAGGVFVERNDGRAHFAGQIVRSSDESCAYYLDVELSQLRAGHPQRSATLQNWTGLEAWAFTDNGGPIAPGFWRNYDRFEGRLVGLRACQGNDFELNDEGLPFQVGVGANGRNLSEGAYGRFGLVRQGAELDEELSGFVSFDLRGVSEEATDVARGGLWIDQIGDDFRFTSGGRLRQEADGTAQITGIVSRHNFPTHRFFVDMQLSGRTDPEEVKGDRPAWTRFKNVGGQLIGLDDLRGARLTILSTGGMASLGLGAHGNSEQQGAQVPFDLHVTSQPSGGVQFANSDSRAGLAVELTRTLEQRAEEALAAPFVQLPGGHALYLPGIAEDFVFPAGGRFQEFVDGTATLEGRVVSLSNPDLGLDIQIDFSGRFDDGQVARVERTLPASAYAERQGPVDTRLWAFYRSSRGILVGTGDLAGAVLEVGQDETALQFGLGANGRNLEYGASGNLRVRLLSQPVGGKALLPETYSGGEVHIDLPRSDRK